MNPVIPLTLPFPAPYAKFVPIEASGIAILGKPVAYLDRVCLATPPYTPAYAWLAVQYPNQEPAVLCILEDCIPSKYRKTRGTLERWVRDAPKHSALQVFLGTPSDIEPSERNA